MKGLRKKIYVYIKLEYAEIDYVYINGGQNKTQSKEIRPQERFVYKDYIFSKIFDTFSFSSYRSNYFVVIHIRPNVTGERLVIKSFVSEHNHIRSKIKIINLEFSFNYQPLCKKNIFVRLYRYMYDHNENSE